ncbi:hypothetical protein MSTO_44080 [Mycobacterium stomatepiae]|uniref:Uncharacterized protein n=1 Tax=Mycobacterium stomatepiae TaxID=470076 RepID=A0A7I7QD11_9MYCO|nr:hypothetical protein MSTO_44080 [Mycobacterium stomatepiae]
MSGTYKVAWKSYTHTWTVTSCGEGCVNVAWDTGANSRATLSDGTWTIDDPASPGAVQFSDGSSGVATPHYSWDAVTLRGDMWNTVPAGTCGLSSSGDTKPDPFISTKLS